MNDYLNLDVVLFVDPYQAENKMMKLFIENAGYAAITVRPNGLDSVDFSPVSLVVLDWDEEKFDGAHLIGMLRAKMSRDALSVPILVLTSDGSGTSQLDILEAGADDYLVRPFNLALFHAKLSALNYQTFVKNSLVDYTKSLEEAKDQYKRESVFARAVYDKIIGSNVSPKGVDVFAASMMDFNGDIVLSKYNPNGNLILLLADFTGHGLSAALGAIPVSEVFDAMVDKSRSLDDLFVTINSKLKAVLPSALFMGAILLEYNPDTRILKLFNANMADVCIRRGNQLLRYPSNNVPLGIVGVEALDVVSYHLQLNGEETLFMFSDGLIEAVNVHNEPYADRLFEHLTQPDTRLPMVVSEFKRYIKATDQADDITLVEMHFADIKMRKERRQSTVDIDKSAIQCDVETRFCGQNLVNTNLKQAVWDYIHVALKIPSAQSVVMRVLNEIFDHALEQGILDLDTTLKYTDHGAYLHTKLKQQNQLTSDHWIRLKVNYSPQSCLLNVELEQSQGHFDLQQALTQSVSAKDDRLFGVALIQPYVLDWQVEKSGRQQQLTLDVYGTYSDGMHS